MTQATHLGRTRDKSVDESDRREDQTTLVGRLFDALEALWTSRAVERTIALALVVTFLGALVVIQARRWGLLPSAIAGFVSTRHFDAVQLAFYLLVLTEVFGLIFGLARSVASSVGKQFEILSLILLRQSFEQLANFEEPVRWSSIIGSPPDSPLLHLLTDAGGAMLIFVLLGLYYRYQRHRPITEDSRDRIAFVEAKKGVALVLLGGFVVFGLRDIWAFWTDHSSPGFFQSFYTLLIFSDVLIVLISLRYSTTYRIVFRNSGFALATVVIRIALAAPPYLNSLLGLAAAGFALVLTIAYNEFAPVLKRAQQDDGTAESEEG